MTKSLKIVFAVVLCLALSVGAVVGGIFGARAVEKNRREAAERQAIQERQEAVSSVENGVLSSVNEKWSDSLTSAEIANLEDAGDYMLAKGWADLIADVVYSSPLQTAKIRRLATAINSEDGKKLFADFEKNAGLIVPLLQDIDFTSGDVSALVCALLESLVDNTARMLGGVRDKLVPYMNLEKTSANVKRVLGSISAELEYVDFSASEKETMKNTLAEAKEGIEALVAFAYNSSINSLSVIFDSEGALVDVTDTEVKTIVNTVLSGTRELKTKMTAENVEKLNAAILAVTNKFDGGIVTSKVFSQLVNWAKYAYVFTDSIPYVCDFLISAGDAVDTAFLNFAFDMHDEIDDSSSNQTIANMSVLSARLERAVFDGVGQARFEEFVQKLKAQALTDYRRALPIVIVDLFVNINSASIDEDGNTPMHTDIITEDVAKDTFAFLLASITLPNFERTYYDFTAGEATLDKLRIAANDCKFENIGIDSNPYSRETNTKEWFEFYVTSAKRKLGEISTRIAPALEADLLAYIGDYFAENSTLKAKTLAHAEREIIHSVAPIAEDATDEEREEYQAKIEARDGKIGEYIESAKDARVYGVAFLLAVVLGDVRF